MIREMQSDAAVMAEINITPFTDVLLVLLIIFMILAALVTPPGFQQAFNPCATPCKTPIRTTARMELTITRSGKMFVGSAPVDARTVYNFLASAAAEHTNLKLSLIADSRAPYGLILRALDAAKEAGIEDVNFVTQ